MSAMTQRPVLLGLAALNAALAVALAAMWLTPQGQLRGVHWAAPAPIQPDYQQMLPALPGAQQPVSATTFLALLERPLFSSSRRPPPPPPPPAAAAPPDLLADAQVLGVYQSGQASGIIARIGGKARRIRLNESLNGWQLHAVQERSALFKSGDQTRELPLQRARIGSAAADPATGAATPGNTPMPGGSDTPLKAQAQSTASSEPAPPKRKSRFGP